MIKASILWILRIAAFMTLIFLMVKPVVVRPDPALPSSWAILLDASRSMRVRDPDVRFEIAKQWIDPMRKLIPHSPVYSFSQDVKELKAREVKGLKANGRKTNLAKALKAVFSKGNLRGAVIFTDGRQVGPGDPVSVAASVAKPLVLVGVGGRSNFKDVAVRSIQSPPFAFKNIQTSLTAILSVVGYEGKEISVRLKERGKILAHQKVRVAGPDIETSVTFHWTPPTLGSKTLTVETGHYENEATSLNNKKEIRLDVGRDRFRVLYICGKPGPEYGFLRHQFKSDPAVELVTFVILRNSSNVVNVPENELSLIPFPSQRDLIDQMATFDLVVFEEFSYRLYGLRPDLLMAIRKRVEGGGSFLLMGGDVVFGPGSQYSLPGIKEMIPVQFGTPEVKTVPETFRFLPRTYSHPILRLEENPLENREKWKAMPLLEGVTLLPGVRKGATVLGQVNYHEKYFPVLTVWKFGKGRVAALATRTTWRWSMAPGVKEPSALAYQQFWKNMVLWLTHSDEYKSVRVALEDQNVRMGETGKAQIWVYDEYFKPISDVDVRVQMIKPGGEQAQLFPRQATKGVFVVPVVGEDLGDHQIRVYAFRKGRKLGGDQTTYRVVEGHFEEEYLRPNFALLKELAHTTGGRFMTADAFSLSAFDELNDELTRKVGRKILLWDSPWSFFVLIILLMAEWTYRKRKGYS